MSLGNNIRKMRKERGWSQEQLANLLGYKSFTTIQKWESGVSDPPIGKLTKVAEIFNVKLSTLANEQPSSNTQINEQEKTLLESYRSLNEEGQEKATEYIEMLDASGKYKKDNKFEMGKEA